MMLRLPMGDSLFEVQPFRWGGTPVIVALRAATQTGDGVKQLLKAMPFSTSESRVGVRICRLPKAPMVSLRCWSVMMKRMFGFWLISQLSSSYQWGALNSI